MKIITPPRYECTCDADRTQTEKDNYVYSRQVVLDLPTWSKAYESRIANNYPPNVSVDSCIADAIKELWRIGIETTGCCCGHCVEKAWVSVDPSNYISMHELGYEQRPVHISESGLAMGVYTFFL
jgi:hypothetical protein